MAALLVLNELARSHHKRPSFSTHVVLTPHLLYQEEWRKRFEKEVDIWFPLQPGEFWPHSTFEPLMVDISFPLYRSYPWLLQVEQDKLVEIGCALLSLPKRCNLQVRDSKVCDGACCAECFVTLPLDLCVIKMSNNFTGATIERVDKSDRFMATHPGDRIYTSFQCPNCQSQNICDRGLYSHYMTDVCFKTLCIRATLGGFCSRSRKTIKDHVRDVRSMSDMELHLGLFQCHLSDPSGWVSTMV